VSVRRVIVPTLVGHKYRTLNSSSEVVEIPAIPFKPKVGKSGEGNMRQGSDLLARWLRVRIDRPEVDDEGFKLRRCGQAGGHRIGRNVSGIGYLLQSEIDKIAGGQKKFR